MIQRELYAPWSARQVHDTVAAIVAQPEYGGQRQSLLGRLLDYIGDQIRRLFDLVRGSIDARIIVAAAVIAIVAIIVARVVIDRRAASRLRRRTFARHRGAEHEDLWSVARQLAAGARYEEAVHALYNAVVESLTAGGHVRHHRSKTAGDYTRELRRAGSSLAATFGTFGSEFDRTAYGRMAITADRYERLRGMAEHLQQALRRAAAA